MSRGIERREYMAAWRAANKEKLRAYFDALYAERRASGYFETPEHKKRRADYYERNRERHNADMAARKKAKPEDVRRHAANRRARIKGAGGKLSPDIESRLMNLQRGCCANCLCRPLKFHLDHIVPVSKGGASVDSNMQLLCQTCNLKKHNKDPIAFAQQQGRLL